MALQQVTEVGCICIPLRERFKPGIKLDDPFILIRTSSIVISGTWGDLMSG